jgi:hypothetical protein
MTGLFALGGVVGVLVGGRFAIVVVGLAIYTFGRSMTSLLVA